MCFFGARKELPFPEGLIFHLALLRKGQEFGEGAGAQRVCEVLRWAWGRGTFYSNLLLGGGGGDEGFVRCGPLGGDACCFSGPDPPASPHPRVVFGVGGAGLAEPSFAEEFMDAVD